MKSWILICATAMLVIELVGCGGNQESKVSPPPEQQPATGLLSLPEPIGLANRVGSALTSSRLGSDYDAVLLPPQKVLPAGEKGLYEPTWISASESGFDDLAYALYTFELPDYEQGHYLNSEWSIPPSSGSYWVALGNMVTDSWKWFNATSGEQLIVPDIENYINTSDILLAVVVVAETGNFMLDQLWFEGEAPTAISVSPTRGEPGASITFSAEVEGTSGISYEWDLGGGAIPNLSNEASPAVFLTTPGIYNASVAVSNYFGRDTLEFELIVGLPIIENVIPTSGNSGQSYLFQSTVISGTPATYAWNFGGGATPNTSIETEPFVTLGNSGTFSASLSVTNSYGSDQFDFSLTIQYPPVADLQATPTTCNSQIPVSFDATDSFDSDGDVVQYDWDWDSDGLYEVEDGSSTREHQYSVIDIGTVNASVRVWDDDGDSDVDTVVIHVEPLTGQKGDWWMFGRNPQHTRRSPYFGAQTNNLKWSLSTGVDPIMSSPTVAVDGTVYVGNNNLNVYAINPDGTEKWVYHSVWSGFISSPAIGSDGTVYIGDEHSKLHAVNPDGSLKWMFSAEAGGKFQSSPAIDSDGTIYVGSIDSKLYAINPDGTEKWSFTTGSAVFSSPAIGADLTVYVGSTDNKLYAINADGTEQWSFETSDDVRSSPSIGSDGTIYVGSWDSNLFAINPNGTEKWAFLTSNQIHSSPAIGTDGTVYAGNILGNFYAINPDGTEKWSFLAGAGVDSSAAIGSDDTIYVGSSDSKLYAINPDGSLKWDSGAIMGGGVYSSPAIGSDGTVYVGCGDGSLYAFGD